MLSELVTLQNRVHGRLQSLVNGGRSVGFPMFSGRRWKARAQETLDDYAKLSQLLGEYDGSALTVSDVRVQAYESNNSFVSEMMTYIERHFDRNELAGAYVHGSLGVYEANAYADFDALVVLRPAVFDSMDAFRSVAKKLYRAQAIMFSMDPLQHHGWFVMTETDFRFYCDTYFPVELFAYARSIDPRSGQIFEVRRRGCGHELEHSFRALAKQVSSEIGRLEESRDAFLVKSLLSQFMLLPAFYLQLLTGSGVFKRESFAMARERHPSEHWTAMDIASEIRSMWRYDVGRGQRKIFSRPGLLRKTGLRVLPPKLDQKISNLLDRNFSRSVRALVSELVCDVDDAVRNGATANIGRQA